MNIIILCTLVIIIIILRITYKKDKEYFKSNNERLCVIDINYPTYLLPTQASGCCNNLWVICDVNDYYCNYPVDFGKYVGILRQIKSTKLDPKKKYKVKVMNLDYAKKWINISDAEFNYI